jgi:CDP-3, 6-dideoxy-D-glycero-L-glycero-4-hexulose-4-reductase
MAQAGVKCFVNTGTYWEHFQSRDYSPVELYAASKFAFQNILQYYVELKGIHAVTLKLFDAYGPNDPRAKLMNLLLRTSKTGELVQMTKGEQKIDLIHVRDVAAAYVAAADRLRNGLAQGHEVYGVGSGNRLSVKDVVNVFERVSGKKINIEWGKRPYREREVMDPCRLEVLPGWVPHIALEEGISSILLLDRNE